MAADLTLLIPEFKIKIEELIQNCADREVTMRPIEGLRAPKKQAIDWRQSRTTEEINKKLLYLKNNDAAYLAEIISGVGPCHGKHVTNAIPGLSWHQWGQALDCVWIVDGKAVWDPESKINGLNGYLVYAEEAVKLGLNAGAYWSSFKDFPHVQYSDQSSPLDVYDLPTINQEMINRFKK